MIDTSFALMVGIPLLLIFIALIFVPFFIARLNQKVFDLLKENMETTRLQYKQERQQEIDKSRITISLQAFERMMLFLERINPTNLVTRVMTPGLTASQFQALLLQNVREEYEHNMSQQLYITGSTWEMIKSAKEEVLSLINISASKLKQDDDGGMLAREILTSGFPGNADPVQKATINLKKELQEIFNV